MSNKLLKYNQNSMLQSTNMHNKPVSLMKTFSMQNLDNFKIWKNNWHPKPQSQFPKLSKEKMIIQVKLKQIQFLMNKEGMRAIQVV